jgi:hypothetical protein
VLDKQFNVGARSHNEISARIFRDGMNLDSLSNSRRRTVQLGAGALR